MSKKEFKEYYKKEDVTGSYDKQREGTKYRKKKRKEELRLFLLLLDKTKKEKVLELGCSSGFLTKHLGKVTAIDTSKKMLKITKKKNPEAKVIEADMFNLPFKKQMFDKIVTMRVWNHLGREDLELALNEASKVLKKRGQIIFDIEEKNSLRRLVNFFYKKLKGIRGFKVYQYSFEEIFFILENNGFSIEEGRTLKHKVGNQIVIKARKE